MAPFLDDVLIRCAIVLPTHMLSETLLSTPTSNISNLWENHFAVYIYLGFIKHLQVVWNTQP